MLEIIAGEAAENYGFEGYSVVDVGELGMSVREPVEVDMDADEHTEDLSDLELLSVAL